MIYKALFSNTPKPVNIPKEKAPMQWYRVTQNKVHHLLAILYLILEDNNTQVSYVVQCIIVKEVQFNEVLFLKCLLKRNISNCAVIWQTV